MWNSNSLQNQYQNAKNKKKNTQNNFTPKILKLNKYIYIYIHIRYNTIRR